MRIFSGTYFQRAVKVVTLRWSDVMVFYIATEVLEITTVSHHTRVSMQPTESP